MGVLSTHASIFWNSFQETEITTTYQMMWTAMRSKSSVTVRRATAMLKIQMLPTGFPVALCNTAIQSFDGHGNRSFLLLRTVDLVFVLVGFVDVLVLEIAARPPGKHLAFWGIILMQRQFLVAVKEVSGAHQHSNEGSNVWRSATVQLS